MNEEYIMVGRVCMSRAGRDKGRPFVVVGRLDEKHVLLADGDLRLLQKPKKKKLMHLAVVNDRLDADEYASNAAIRKALVKRGYTGCKG